MVPSIRNNIIFLERDRGMCRASSPFSRGEKVRSRGNAHDTDRPPNTSKGDANTV